MSERVEDENALTVEPPPAGRTRYVTKSSIWIVDAEAGTIEREARPDSPHLGFAAAPYYQLRVRHRGGRPSSVRTTLMDGLAFTSGRIERVETEAGEGS